MGLFRKKKQNKAVATAEKIEPTLIIEASDNQPEALKRGESYLPLLPSA